jgi:Na+/melibiose symporter-like transporter
MAVFSIIAIPVDALLTLTLLYMPAYFAATLGMSLTAVAAAFAACRTIDIPLGPAIGAVMDRTRSWIGRYRLWAIVSAPAISLGMIMLTVAREGAGSVYLGFWLLVIYVAMTTLSLAHSAWAAALARTYEDRARLFAMILCLGAVGALGILSLPVLMGRLGYPEPQRIRAMFWLVAIVAPVTVAIVAVTTPEPVAVERTGSRGFRVRDYLGLVVHPSMGRILLSDFCFTLGPSWASAMSLFFARDRLGFSLTDVSLLLIVGILAAVPGVQAAGWLAARIGKHRAAIILALLEVVGMGSLLLIPRGNIPAALPSYALNGMVNLGFAAIIRSMVADVADEVRLAQGEERSGLLFSLITFVQQVGAAIAIVIAFPLLAHVGYDPRIGRANTPQAIQGLAWLFVSGPIVLSLAGAALLAGYPLNAQRLAAIRRELDALDHPAGVAADAGEVPPPVVAAQ